MLVANLNANQNHVMASQVGIEELYKFSKETSGGEDLGLSDEEIVFTRETARTSVVGKA
jgi:hypothetical protein